ncbi:uncharacterized protein Dvar_32100 [Desulfosarcina variabilis str. Montpellier]
MEVKQCHRKALKTPIQLINNLQKIPFPTKYRKLSAIEKQVRNFFTKLMKPINYPTPKPM